jgi:hypothetical protein
MRPEIANQLAWLLGRGGWGRRSLARATGVGEIGVRQELERLRSQGLVEMDRRGTRLTPRGEQEFAAVIAKVKAVKELELRELGLDCLTAGAAIKGAAGCGPSWHLRDLAIRAGASGAVLIECVSGGLRFADSGEPLAARNPRDAALLRESFPVQVGDLIVLVSAPDRRSAHLGLWKIITALLSH